MARRAPVSRKYEMMVVVAPTVTEDGLPRVAERVAGYVTDQGGEIEIYTHQNPWGHRRLAYPIQGHQDAFYVLYYFTTPTNSIDEIDRQMSLDSQLIRHLIVKYDPLADSDYGRPQQQSAETTETAEEAATEEAGGAEATSAEAGEAANEAESAEESAEEESAESETNEEEATEVSTDEESEEKE